MEIGKVAALCGVSVRALRHYESVGLIRSTRANNGYRDFVPDVVPLVRRIRRLLALGFSTREIASILPGLVSETAIATDCVAVTAAHRAKLDQVEARIAAMEAQRRALLAELQHADARAPCTCRTEEMDHGTATDRTVFLADREPEEDRHPGRGGRAPLRREAGGHRQGGSVRA